MPRAIPVPCTHPGCGALVRGGSLCRQHRSDRFGPQDPARAGSSERGYGAGWRRLRAMVLAREPLCRACGAPATDVDHVTPKSAGGGDDEANLQALCGACHRGKTIRESVRRRACGRLVVVTGPPCSGKTTYAREHARRGDMVYDLDALADALFPAGVDRAELAACASALREAILSIGWPRDIYCIVTDEEQAVRLSRGSNGACVIRCSADLETLLRRLDARALEPARRAQVHRAISAWGARPQAPRASSPAGGVASARPG